jgi:hypothetical protein
VVGRTGVELVSLPLGLSLASAWRVKQQVVKMYMNLRAAKKLHLHEEPVHRLKMRRRKVILHQTARNHVVVQLDKKVLQTRAAKEALQKQMMLEKMEMKKINARSVRTLTVVKKIQGMEAVFQAGLEVAGMGALLRSVQKWPVTPKMVTTPLLRMFMGQVIAVQIVGAQIVLEGQLVVVQRWQMFLHLLVGIVENLCLKVMVKLMRAEGESVVVAAIIRRQQVH